MGPAHDEKHRRGRGPETHRWQGRLPLPPAGWLLAPLAGAGQQWAAGLEVLHGQQPALCGVEASSLFPGVTEEASWASYSWKLFPKSGQDVHALSQAGINNH